LTDSYVFTVAHSLSLSFAFVHILSFAFVHILSFAFVHILSFAFIHILFALVRFRLLSRLASVSLSFTFFRFRLLSCDYYRWQDVSEYTDKHLSAAVPAPSDTTASLQAHMAAIRQVAATPQHIHCTYSILQCWPLLEHYGRIFSVYVLRLVIRQLVAKAPLILTVG
jgi:hypothetical protein